MRTTISAKLLPDSHFQNVLVPGPVLPQVENFTILHVQLHDVPVRPVLQSEEVLLNGDTTIWHISYSSPFCIISKVAGSVLCPNNRSINEDVKQHWPQY